MVEKKSKEVRKKEIKVDKPVNIWIKRAQDTMRGIPILTKSTPSETSSMEGESFAWEYTMKWSNGVSDLLTYFIPEIVGGSSWESISNTSNFARITDQANNREVCAPWYWGDLISTREASYVFKFTLLSLLSAEIISNIASILLILLLITYSDHQFKPLPILSHMNVNSL